MESPLIGLRAGVSEEDPGVGRVGAGEDESDELLGEGDLRRGGEEVRHVPEGAQLRGDGPHCYKKINDFKCSKIKIKVKKFKKINVTQ